MAGIPFVGIIDPLRYAEAEVVSPKIRRVIARNPSNFTFTGTGTYLVGNATDVAVIDPGPDLPEHRTALLRAIEGQKVRAIVNARLRVLLVLIQTILRSVSLLILNLNPMFASVMVKSRLTAMAGH